MRSPFEKDPPAHTLMVFVERAWRAIGLGVVEEEQAVGRVPEEESADGAARSAG